MRLAHWLSFGTVLVGALLVVGVLVVALVLAWRGHALTSLALATGAVALWVNLGQAGVWVYERLERA